MSHVHRLPPPPPKKKNNNANPASFHLTASILSPHYATLPCPTPPCRDSCLEGRTLEFYRWGSDGDADVKELLDGVRIKIDAMAKDWSPEDKAACVEETGRTFQYGGRLLSSVTS